jgi:hypothetical protein
MINKKTQREITQTKIKSRKRKVLTTSKALIIASSLHTLFTLYESSNLNAPE